MARGHSGRIVIEVDPNFKDNLYVALARTRLTLKDWFIKEGEQFIRSQNQLQLFRDIEDGEGTASPHDKARRED
jgi:hypothetical protein